MEQARITNRRTRVEGERERERERCFGKLNQNESERKSD